jgi:hypothetical protein
MYVRYPLSFEIPTFFLPYRERVSSFPSAQ